MERLFRLSLILSITGILFLLFLSNLLEPKLIAIEKIDYRMLNQKVKVSGEIFNIRTYEKSDFQILSIKDETGKVDVTLNNILNLTNNQEIIVIGGVSEYEQHLQVRADKIIKK